MNERIKELAKQSGAWDYYEITTFSERIDGDEKPLEKFAELIVRECAGVAHNKQYKHSPAHTVGDCATAIKEHFGVE